MSAPDPGVLRGLLARVEAASGPDRDLDGRLDYFFTWECEDREWDNLGGYWREHRATKQRERFSPPPTPELTASVDAALGLMERVLPEANAYGIEREPSGWTAYVSRNLRDGYWYFGAERPTAPLAILSALLKAKSSTLPKGDG